MKSIKDTRGSRDQKMLSPPHTINAKAVRGKGNLTIFKTFDLQIIMPRSPPIVRSQVADLGTKKDKGQSKKTKTKIILL